MAENYFKKYPNNDVFFNEHGGAFITPHLEVIDAFFELSRQEGIIPALESAYAVAYIKNCSKISQTINFSKFKWSWDKDLDYVVDTFGLPD